MSLNGSGAADDGDAFDSSAIVGLSEVFPAGALPTTIGELKDFADDLVFGDLPQHNDPATDLGTLIGDRLQAMGAAERASALEQPDTTSGNKKRRNLVRAALNPVTADEYESMAVDERKQRLVFVGSVAASATTMRQAWKRVYGLSFDQAGKAVDAEDVGGNFTAPAAVANLVATIEAHMGTAMVGSRPDLEAFVAMVAPGILPDVTSLSDEHLVVCAHRCLDCMASRQLKEVVAGAADWRAAIGGVDQDDMNEVAFAAPASDIAICFDAAANSLEGLASIADALGVPRSSGKAMLKDIDEQVAGWSVSTVESVRGTPGSAAAKIAAVPGIFGADPKAPSTSVPAALARLTKAAGLADSDARRIHDGGLSAEALLSARSIGDLALFKDSVDLPTLARLFNVACREKDAHNDFTNASSTNGSVRAAELVGYSSDCAARISALASTDLGGQATLEAAIAISQSNNAACILAHSEVPAAAKFCQWRTAFAVIEAAIAEVLTGHEAFALGTPPAFATSFTRAIRCGDIGAMIKDPSWAAIARAVAATPPPAGSAFCLLDPDGANAVAAVVDDVFDDWHGSSIRRSLLDPVFALVRAGLESSMASAFGSRITGDFQRRCRQTRNAASLTGNIVWPNLKPEGQVLDDCNAAKRTAAIVRAVVPPVAPAQAPAPGERGPKRQGEHLQPCNYFAAGTCAKGANCRFSHNGPVKSPRVDGANPGGGGPGGGGPGGKGLGGDKAKPAPRRFGIKNPPGFIPGKTTGKELDNLRQAWLSANTECFNTVHSGFCFNSARPSGCDRCK